MKPTLGHIELFVRDPARSMEFYRDVLGFELTADQGPSYFWLKSGTTEIVLRPARSSATAPTYGDAPFGFVLYTSDLPATLEMLKNRGLTPKGTDGSPNCPTFVDPDGHWIQIVDPADHRT